MCMYKHFIYRTKHLFQVIAACAVLHNICLGVGDIAAPGDEPKDDVQDEGETGLHHFDLASF